MRLFCLALAACTGGGSSVVPANDGSANPVNNDGPELIVAASRFDLIDGKVQTLPAELEIRSAAGELRATLTDKDSNVFHKALPWRGGVLTIGGDGARLVHWTWSGDTATPTLLYSGSFGGDHDRLRDIEVGNVDADAADELIIATHDQGVVLVLDEGPDGLWTATELGRTPNIFVHEIELGDLDGDGRLEIYCTPSEPNHSSGASQPGRIERWSYSGERYERRVITTFEGTHAKEILVADLGEGPVLLALQEGRTGPANLLVDPVSVVQISPGAKADEPWSIKPLTTLLGERQARFLLAGDVDNDGVVELVATGMSTGVWLLDRPGVDLPYAATQIDGSSGGFEQAAYLGEPDGAGARSLYVASEPGSGKPRQIRRYRWSEGRFERTILATLEGQGLVWGLTVADVLK